MGRFDFALAVTLIDDNFLDKLVEHGNGEFSKDGVVVYQRNEVFGAGTAGKVDDSPQTNMDRSEDIVFSNAMEALGDDGLTTVVGALDMFSVSDIIEIPKLVGKNLELFWDFNIDINSSEGNKLSTSFIQSKSYSLE